MEQLYKKWNNENNLHIWRFKRLCIMVKAIYCYLESDITKFWNFLRLNLFPLNYYLILNVRNQVSGAPIRGNTLHVFSDHNMFSIFELLPFTFRSLIQFYCSANQYSKIACFFTKILKWRAGTKRNITKANIFLLIYFMSCF